MCFILQAEKLLKFDGEDAARAAATLRDSTKMAKNSIIMDLFSRIDQARGNHGKIKAHAKSILDTFSDEKEIAQELFLLYIGNCKAITERGLND